MQSLTVLGDTTSKTFKIEADEEREAVGRRVDIVSKEIDGVYK